MFEYRGEVWAGRCELDLITIVSFFLVCVCACVCSKIVVLSSVCEEDVKKMYPKSIIRIGVCVLCTSNKAWKL